MDEKSDETKENIIALIIVILIATGAGAWVYYQLQAPPVEERVSIPIAGSPTLGASEAPVAIVIFSDFECPFCATVASETFPIIKEYAENGTILFVFKQFPLDTHPHALNAAQASLCAEEQNRFWEYHDMLYENQAALTADDLASYAQRLDLNMTRFESCMQRMPERVLQEKRLGQQVGVSGTPTFFFNGRRVAGALSPAEFAAELENERS